MKRYKPALFAIALTVTLFAAACGSSGSGSGSGSTSGAADQTAQYDTLNGDELSVVTNLALEPYRYTENGKYAGFEIDLTEKIAHDLGFKSVKWSNIDWDSLITDVAAGKHDVAIAGINGWSKPGSLIYQVVQDRTKIVSFSQPYFMGFWSLVTNKKTNPDLTNVSQLKKGMVDIQLSGTTEYLWAKQNLEPLGVTVRATNSTTAEFVAIESGLATSTIEEGTSLHAALKQHPNLQQGDDVTGLSAGFAYAFSHSHNALREAINKELTTLFNNGYYASLYKKYFPWLTPPASLPTNSFVGSSS